MLLHIVSRTPDWVFSLFAVLRAGSALYGPLGGLFLSRAAA